MPKKRMNDLPLSHLQLVRAPALDAASPVMTIANTIGYYRKRYRGVLIANGCYDALSAVRAISKGHADLISFAALFIANPDLVRRFAEDLPLAASDRTTRYQGGVEGYLAYPAYADIRSAATFG